MVKPDKFKSSYFGIKHYAQEVKYNTEFFVDKNKDSQD